MALATYFHRRIHRRLGARRYMASIRTRARRSKHRRGMESRSRPGNQSNRPLPDNHALERARRAERLLVILRETVEHP